VEKRSSQETAVCALDSLRDAFDWSDVYFRSVLAPASCHGQLFALPVGVHHLNLLFYNHEVYADLQREAKSLGLELLDPPELHSARDLVAQLKVIDQLGMRHDGKPLVPLALSTKENEEWPLAILAFENVLLSLSRDAYKMVWEGGLARGTGNSPEQLAPTLGEMLEVLRAMVGPNGLPADLDWKDAVHQVGDGAAVFTVMGDWAWAQLSPEQRERVTAISYPGTADTFVYTPDSFAVPKELEKNGFPARSFLQDIVSQKNLLIEFANLKYSIPPRSDLEPDDIDQLGPESIRETYRQFKDCEDGGCELLLAVSGLAPPPGVDPCFDDIDALLKVAVTGFPPSAEQRMALRCPAPFLETADAADAADAAAARLVELLLEVAKQRFASECR
jgi:glucose/mannose transport system substrate-binding protein